MCVFYHPEICSPNICSLDTYSPVNKGCITLSKEEFKHAKATRKTSGDTVFVTDGKGTLHEGKITIHRNNAEIILSQNAQTTSSPPPKGHLCIAPTKNTSRIEWLVEKCTELGVKSISFFHSQRTERKTINRERFIRKAIAAVKQSRQLYLPFIFDIVDFKTLINNRLNENKDKIIHHVAYVAKDTKYHLTKQLTTTEEHCVWIGPEGGFTNDEITLLVKKGASTCSLGNTRLRTETAAVFSISLIHALC